MSTNYGVFAEFIPTIGATVAAAGAIWLSFKGRARWEPAEEDVPALAQRSGILLAAVSITMVWYVGTTNPGYVVPMSVPFAVLTVLFSLLYGYLVGWLTYSKEVALNRNQTVTRKIIGGFRLTPRAEALARQGKSISDIFSGLAYKEDDVWVRESRAAAKAAFSLVYIALVAASTSTLTSTAILISQRDAIGGGGGLETRMNQWLQEAEKAREARTVGSISPFPTSFMSARSGFETAWQNSSLPVRKQLDQTKVAKALSYVNRTYRLQEADSPTQRNALFWCDIAIRHFEEIQDRDKLVEALLDKSAVYLDLAQLEHKNQQDFLDVSKAGDAVITRALGMARQDKKDEVYRISSRFYYNLARPKSFRLSDTWDNAYLLLSYARAKEAFDLNKGDIKNANQLLRAAMKASKNPPQDKDLSWAHTLRAAKDGMKSAWEMNNGSLAGIGRRLSPLNVLGAGTIETIAREWHFFTASQRKDKAPVFLNEIEKDGLAPLREAEALLQNDALRRSYGFDLRYDIARGYAQRVQMLRATNKATAKQEFDEVVANLLKARSSASATQIDAAINDVSRDYSLAGLSTTEKATLVKLLRTGGV